MPESPDIVAKPRTEFDADAEFQGWLKPEFQREDFKSVIVKLPFHVRWGRVIADAVTIAIMIALCAFLFWQLWEHTNHTTTVRYEITVNGGKVQQVEIGKPLVIYNTTAPANTPTSTLTLGAPPQSPVPPAHTMDDATQLTMP